MRILHVISSCAPAVGGPIEAIRQAARTLEPGGHTSEIACLDAPESPWLADLPVKTHPLGPGRFRYGFAPRFDGWLRAQAGRFDCVISHGLWEYSSLGTWRALRGSPTPYFVYAHGMLDPTHKTTFPLKHLKKALYWSLAEHRVLRGARAVFFTCEQERDLAQTTFRPYQCNPSIVSYCVGSPPDEREAGANLFLDQFPELRGRRLLLFLGRIHYKKGCDLLIEAFSQVAMQDKSLHLVMAGPDSTGWKPKLERLAKSLGIESRITWTGMLRDNLKWSAFRAAEAFVLPTHQENFGIAIVEALACGTPVLITNRVNIWREIHQAGAGLVSSVGRAETVQLLKSWLSLPAEDRAAMRLRARACFATHFHSEQAGKTLVATLRSCGVNG